MEILINTKFNIGQKVFLKSGFTILESEVDGILIKDFTPTDWPWAKTGEPVLPKIKYTLVLDREKDDRKLYDEDILFEDHESAISSSEFGILGKAVMVAFFAAGASILFDRFKNLTSKDQKEES